MSASIGLLAAALLFWGQQTGLWVPALVLGALAEGWRATSRRFDLARSDFSRISDLSALGFFGMAVYLYVTRPANAAFMTLSAWLPMALFPLLASQLYSARGRLDVRSLFVFMRKWPADPEWTADIAYPYLILCVLAAGAANNRTAAFYPELCALGAWAIWPARPKGSSGLAWAGFLFIACGLGYEGQRRLSSLQNALENKAVDLFFVEHGVGFDADEATTALGHIGRLKFSDRIALRLTVSPGAPVPALLRTAVYDQYARRRWTAWRSAFEAVSRRQESWSLGPAHDGAQEASISLSLEGGAGLLPLPAGSFLVDGPAFGTLSRSRLGDVRIDDGPGLASVKARFSPGDPPADPPDALDLQLPLSDAALMRGIAARLGLSARHPREALELLRRYFDEGFSYNLYRDGPDPGDGAIAEFLTKTHAGHCEYFATAAVLILRAAGIPARYAKGYSLQEYSRLEGAWIARDRHSHAWALVDVGGHWIDFDATPATWGRIEAARAPWWEGVRDAWAWAAFQFSRWRWSQAGRRRFGGPWVWALLLPVAATAWKWRPSFKKARAAAAGLRSAPSPGSDSPWYRVEEALTREGFGRRPWESSAAWLSRLGAAPGSPLEVAALRPLLELHNRARFDTEGLSRTDKEALKAGVAEWLEDSWN